MYSASIENTTTQSIPTNSTTLLEFNSTLWSTGCTVDLSSSNESIEVGASGIYCMSIAYRFGAAPGSGKLNTYFFKEPSGASGFVRIDEGGATNVRSLDTSEEMLNQHHCILNLQAGDAIQCRLFQNSGSSMTLGSSSVEIYRTRLTVAYLGSG